MRTLPLRRLDSATSALATRHLWRLRLRGIGIALPQYFPLEPHLTLLLIYIFFQNSNLLWSIKYDSDKLLQNIMTVCPSVCIMILRLHMCCAVKREIKQLSRYGYQYIVHIRNISIAQLAILLSMLINDDYYGECSVFHILCTLLVFPVCFLTIACTGLRDVCSIPTEKQVEAMLRLNV